MSRFGRYTTEELSFITEALEAGFKKRQIAEFFGVSPQAITAVLHRHNIHQDSHPKEDLERMARRYKLLSITKRDEVIKSALDESNT